MHLEATIQKAKVRCFLYYFVVVLLSPHGISSSHHGIYWQLLEEGEAEFFRFPLTCWFVISASVSIRRIKSDPEYHKSVLGVDIKNFGKSVHCNKIFDILLMNNVLLTLFLCQISIEEEGPELVRQNYKEF